MCLGTMGGGQQGLQEDHVDPTLFGEKMEWMQRSSSLVSSPSGSPQITTCPERTSCRGGHKN